MGFVEWCGKQMRMPEGWGGRMMCRFLLLQHAGLVGWTLDLMDIQPEDSILDVGCGNGSAVQRMASRAANGFVAGIDPSPVSVEVACRRNAPLITSGRTAITLGSVQSLPYENGCFDKVSAIESYYYWEDHCAALREIHRILKPRGKLTIVMEMTKDLPNLERNLALARKMDCPIFSGAEVADSLRASGFSEVSHGMDPRNRWLSVQGTRAHAHL